MPDPVVVRDAKTRRETVTYHAWAVLRYGHLPGEMPLASFPTGGQADAYARHFQGGAKVVPILVTYTVNF